MLASSAEKSKSVFSNFEGYGLMYCSDAPTRAEEIGKYVSETGATVRAAAKKFGVSKSTVHKDLTARLKQQNLPLYEEVQRVLRTNKEERHKRGGNATRLKYLAAKH